MKRILCLVSVSCLLFLGLLATIVHAQSPAATSASEMDGLMAFDEMMDVLSHQRCVNCHPSGDRPRQGDDRHLHRFNVQRGEDGHGVAAVACGTCHQSENNLYSGVPGAPQWHLAPRSMVWEGLSRVEIARSMLDPERNGGKTPVEIEKHLTEDLLVLWAFDPGVDHEGTAREAPPVSEDDYIAAVKAWFAAGSPIPDDSDDSDEDE